MLWIETPTNPLMSIFDIAALSRFAHEREALVVVDNTFATPYLQQPLALGADIVVHSTTKYLGGHSDVIGGAVVTSDDGVADRIRFLQNAIGGVPGPWDVWLVLRGLRTLPVRMRAHCDNARAVVAALRDLPAVSEVLWPGLESHPGHDVAAAQMRDFGGMVSFRMRSRDAALRACDRFEVFTLAESLGSVESLVEHPGLMTHQSVAGSPLEVPDDLVRLSVGIEDANDLVADICKAVG
jgi:cystathionine gamma-synthase